ncbi:MAG TPA: dihydroxy-acid dehydratase [Solirubrobacteraceae bacterium]|nr:dihydroxy-acid dehydratase [Solirubrobacteraceae bacterium]
MTLPSRHVTEGMHNALNRIYFHAMGLVRDDIDRPMVGVGTAWHGASPAGELPLRVARAAEEGVWSGGATPRQFATIADVDGAGLATLRPGLVTRELVADSVELTVRGHSYDALVAVGAGPLALAGLMLAMCRLDVPSLVVPLAGRAFGSDADADALAVAAETLGLALPGAAAAGDAVATALAAADGAGAGVASRLAEAVDPRQLVTATSLRRAAAKLGELDANPALTIHLAALAVECGVDLSLGDLAGAMGEAAGRPSWVEGSLAPEGALLHGPAARSSGRAQVFDDERAACDWVAAERWPEATVLVVRRQGPLGGPGMPALDALAAVVDRAGAPPGALLVTDGRAPAIHGVACVTAVGPEAAAGGALAALRDGDVVSLDGSAGTIDAAIPDRSWGAAPDPSGEPDLPPALAKYRRTVRPAAWGASTHPGAAAETVRYGDL